MENKMLKRNAVRIGFLPTARAKGIGEGFLAVEAVGHGEVLDKATLFFMSETDLNKISPN